MANIELSDYCKRWIVLHLDDDVRVGLRAAAVGEDVAMVGEVVRLACRYLVGDFLGEEPWAGWQELAGSADAPGKRACQKICVTPIWIN